jgi:hypothetical protein
MTRTVRIITPLLLILILAIGSGYAQAGRAGIKVAVPFSFTVGQGTFSPGDYFIFSRLDKVWVRDTTGRTVVMLVSDPIEGRVPERDGRAVFACYSDQCFLSQVWIAGQDSGRILPKSKRQLRLANAQPGQLYSLIGTNPAH